ncbi:MAG TPA: hypothetical protein VFD40_00960 [Candidatus Paceibacterota bacterium]|nr:hypothetical protein [Candidatus Paceibacterota bacterium]
MKSCTIAVIVLIFSPFFTKAWKKIQFFYETWITSLSSMIAENQTLVVIIASIVAVVLVLWVIKDDNEMEKIEEKKEEAE